MPVKPSRKTPVIPFSKEGDVTRLVSKVSSKDVRALLHNPAAVSASLNVPSPGGNAASGLKPFSTPDGSKFEVALSKLKPYDRNPRRAANTAFDEIKDSLRATGPGSLDLWVTQRPGEEAYMPYRGGNTRLAAARLLAQEGDPRWERLVVTYKQWVSEADTLAQHLIENNNRADMTFWDKACAYLVDMRAEIEQEFGAGLSLRRLEEEFARRGVGMKKSLLSLFQFAVQRLSPVGPYLSATQVIQMQPAINLMARLATKFDLEEAAFQEALDAICLSRLDDLKNRDATGQGQEEAGLRAGDLIAALEVAMAERLEAKNTKELRHWMDTLERFPDIPLDDLRRSTRVPSPPSAAVPASTPRSSAPSSAEASPSSPRHAPEKSDGISTKEASESAHAGEQQEPGIEAAKSDGGATHVPTASASQEPDTPHSQATTPASTIGSRLEAVTALAEAACVDDCLRRHAAMPAGFYMEVPASAIDVDVECRDMSLRVVAWQLLSLLSGQWDLETAQRLPQDSLWRRMRLAEGGLDHETLPLFIQDQLLTDIGSQTLKGADDLGWGVLLQAGWVINLLTDPACAAALTGVFQHFSRGQE